MDRDPDPVVERGEYFHQPVSGEAPETSVADARKIRRVNDGQARRLLLPPHESSRFDCQRSS